MQLLVDGQRTLRRTFLTAVYQAASSHGAVSDTTRTDLRAAWGVLAAAEAERPAAFASVLDHPFVRAWAVRCLGRLQELTPEPAEPQPGALRADLGYLGALAASAAIRAGVAAEVSVPVLDGAVPLPTLGRLVLGPGQTGLTAVRLVMDDDVVRFQAGADGWKLATGDLIRGDADPLLAGDDHRTAEWQVTRILRAPGVSVALEDGDPYRDCYGPAATSRLSSAQFGEWQEAFTDAWAKIRTAFPAYAPAIAAGLRCWCPGRPGWSRTAPSPPTGTRWARWRCPGPPTLPAWPGSSWLRSSAPSSARFSTSSICTIWLCRSRGRSPVCCPGPTQNWPSGPGTP